jgi:cardiolipin synthase
MIHWFFWSAAGIGLMALVFLVLYYFTPVGKRVRPISVLPGTLPANTDPAFIQSTAALTYAAPFQFASASYRLIESGEAFYQSLRADLQAAERHIYIMTFLWDSGPKTSELFQILAAKAQSGVTVRLIVDAFGNSLSTDDRSLLTGSGVQILDYHPFAFGQISRWHTRCHARAFVIDGEVGYWGGMTMHDGWFSHDQDELHFTDTMCRATGSAVSHLEATFVRIWLRETRELIHVTKPPLVLATSGTANALYLHHQPRLGAYPYSDLLQLLIHSARESIVIVSPYFLPGELVRDALIQKAAAGVSVTILTQSKSDHTSVLHATRHDYRQYVQAGVAVHEYTPSVLHTKVVLIDKTVIVTGSANCDIRSQRLNDENVIVTNDATLIQDHISVLQRYYEHSEQITPATVRGYSVSAKIAQAFWYIFREQM